MARGDSEEDNKESTSDKNLRLYGTRIPNVEQKRAVDAYLKAADEAYMRGGSEPVKDGLNELGQPISTVGMSDTDAFFAKGRARDKQQLGEYKSFGDKSRADTINAMRKLQGRAPKAFVPDEFDRLLDTSVTFADKSALLTDKGRQEAVRQGVGAGLSAEDAINKVQKAYDLLKKFSGKQDGGQPTTPNQTTQPTTTTTTDTAKTTQPTPPEQKTVEEETRQMVQENVIEPALGGEKRSPIMQTGQVAQGLTGIARAYEALKKAELDNLNKIAQGKSVADLSKEAKTLQQAAAQAGAKVPHMQRLAKGALTGSPLAKGLQTVTDAAEVAAKTASGGTKATAAAAQIPKAQRAADIASKVTGNKLVKGLGRFGAVAAVTEPALETFKYATDMDLLDKKIEEMADLQEKGLGATVGKTVMDTVPIPAQAFNPNYSPVGTLAATIGAPMEQVRRLRLAEGDLAAAQLEQRLSEKRGAEMQKLRQEMFPESTRENTTPEEFASQMDKVREAYRKLRTQRK